MRHVSYLKPLDSAHLAELAMHLYRKFHARGGVRRVYATADKNWDRCEPLPVSSLAHGIWMPHTQDHHLDLAEFSKLIKTYLKDAVRFDL